VREWNDAVISDSFRGVWGGSWNDDELDLRSSSRDFEAPDSKDNLIGFRVASP
jgi:formylglycine-generating enzyme required for sulfatase activity